MKIAFTTLLIYLMSATHCAAQHQADKPPLRFFIDFLKQEKVYHDDIIYYPFPFEDIDCGHLFPHPQSVNTSEEMRQLIAQSISYNSNDSSIYYNNKLRLPYHIKVDVLDKEHYHAEAFVNQPDSSGTLYLNTQNLGIPQCFDKTEITLMSIEDNVAYLLVENKNELVDYSYTKPGYIFKDDDKEECEEVKREWQPYSSSTDIVGQYTFTGYYRIKEKNNPKYFSVARISAVVQNAQGTMLDFGTITEDFRHYLWYRNMDMPYSEMAGDYAQLQKRYATPPSDNRFYPMYVVRLQASGRIDNLTVTIHSLAVRPPLRLELAGKFVSPDNNYYKMPTLDERTRQISTIRNANADSMDIKPVVVPYAIYPKRKKIAIAAYLPVPGCFNIKKSSAQLRFSSLTYNFEGDSYTQEGELAREHFDEDYLGYHQGYQNPYGNALDLVAIPIPISNSDTLRGELKYYYPNLEAIRYDLPQLPEGWNYKEKALTIPYDDEVSFGDIEGYDEQGESVPQINYSRTSENSTVIFERPLKACIIIKGLRDAEGTIPFNLPLIPPGWKEK